MRLGLREKSFGRDYSFVTPSNLRTDMTLNRFVRHRNSNVTDVLKIKVQLPGTACEYAFSGTTGGPLARLSRMA